MDNFHIDIYSQQVDINCSSLPAGLGGNGEFERKFEGIREEISQNEVSLGGSPKIKVTLIIGFHIPALSWEWSGEAG